MVLPSVLEHYQTAVRDPGFWMIFKRVLNLVDSWHRQLPLWKKEQLALPWVVIKDVDVDKLVTYFENTYVNVTNYLPLSEQEGKYFYKKKNTTFSNIFINYCFM